jgi:hypothetical protein
VLSSPPSFKADALTRPQGRVNTRPARGGVPAAQRRRDTPRDPF